MAINDSSVDETHLMEHCPRLASLMDETLRLTVTSSLARTITEPTVIGKKVLKPGNKIMVHSSVSR